MQGLELARKYYDTYGKPMLEQQFPGLLPKLAIGLCGGGSECFGFDDDVSQDHDFEPGFCIFLPDAEIVSEREAFLLERAYAKLPRQFEGIDRMRLSPVGGNRHGVLRASDFFREKTGSVDGILSTEQWLSIRDFFLAEAVNGEIFRDDSGFFSEIRSRLSEYPEDIRKKRLAGYLLNASQAGQYQYQRCISHREYGAAQLAIAEFVQSAMQSAFLLEKKYMPYYKWSFRALRKLSEPYALLSEALTYLLTTDNEEEMTTKIQVISDISSILCEGCFQQNLCDRQTCLADCAYTVNDGINDAEIRNLHILTAVG